jgi:hypothetical protein
MLALLAALIACAPPPAIEVARGTPLDQLPPPAVCAPGEVARFGGVAYPDIQAALDAAAGGGTVTICTGVHYVSNLTYASAGPIRVAGETDDPNDVILDGTFNGRIITFSNYLSDNYVSGISFIHAGEQTMSIADVEAIFHEGSDGTFLIRRCRFIDGVSELGAAFTLHASRNIVQEIDIIGHSQLLGHIARIFPTTSKDQYSELSNSYISNNIFGEAGFAITSGAPTIDSVVRVQDVHFEDNRTMNGGALDIRVREGRSRVTVERASFVNNRSEGNTAGLRVSLSRPDVLNFGITDSLFEDNTAVLGDIYAGAALTVDGWAATYPPNTRYDAMIHNTTFRRNTKRPGPYGAVWLNDRFRTQWIDVDFGTGADANFPADISECATTSLGAGVRGRTDGFRGDNCP